MMPGYKNHSWHVGPGGEELISRGAISEDECLRKRYLKESTVMELMRGKDSSGKRKVFLSMD